MDPESFDQAAILAVESSRWSRKQAPPPFQPRRSGESLSVFKRRVKKARAALLAHRARLSMELRQLNKLSEE